MPSRIATARRLSRGVPATTFVILTSLFALGTPTAQAQTGGPVFNRNPGVVESDGEVVLTLSISWARPARVRYQTFDAEAKSPGDYTAVSGEAVFAGGNSWQIKIPIVDDDVAEDDETFTVRAWEEPDDGWPWGVATVRIADDDRAVGTGPPAAVTSTTSDAVGVRSPVEPRSGVAVDPPTTTAAPPSPGLQVALPDGEFRPGPGFELTSEGAPETAAQRRGGGGGSAAGLVIGSGTAALGVGALAIVRRRRRWSPTQA